MDEAQLSLTRNEFDGLFEELQKKCEDRSELWESECQCLVESTYDLYSLAQSFAENKRNEESENVSLKTEVKKLEAKVASLETQLEKLKKKLMNIESKLQISKAEKLQLLVGEVARKAEKGIAEEILDKAVKGHNIVLIKDMEKAIDSKERYYASVFKTEEQRVAAENNWASLQIELDWSPELFFYSKCQRLSRNSLAHAYIDKEDVMKNIIDKDAPGLDKEKFKKLWTIYNRYY